MHQTTLAGSINTQSEFDFAHPAMESEIIWGSPSLNIWKLALVWETGKKNSLVQYLFGHRRGKFLQNVQFFKASVGFICACVSVCVAFQVTGRHSYKNTITLLISHKTADLLLLGQCLSCYHVDNLRQCNLQGHIQYVVGVLHRPQRAGVVGEQVGQELLSECAVSAQTG